MAELKQGCTLKNGKYKVVKTLGQGSFGITYLATTRVSMDGQLGKLDVDVNVTIKEFFMCDYSSINELSDKKYRLPTIAEWLLAAKPDSGNKISKLGWFRESGHSLHDVGLKAPNSYGLYDMLGNAHEWCQERFNINNSETQVSSSINGHLLGNVHEWCQERFNINNSETQVSSSINGHFAAECGGHFDAHVNSFPYFSGAEIDAVGNCNSVTGFRIARDIN